MEIGLDLQQDTPESIQAWIEWYDALEPIEFTADERAAWQRARQEEHDIELADWDRESSIM